MLGKALETVHHHLIYPGSFYPACCRIYFLAILLPLALSWIIDLLAVLANGRIGGIFPIGFVSSGGALFGTLDRIILQGYALLIRSRLLFHDGNTQNNIFKGFAAENQMCYPVFTLQINTAEVVFMYRLTFEKRAWIVKQYLKGVPTSKIVLSQSVTRMTVCNILRAYRELGWDGLKDHKTGRSEVQLNPLAEILILDLRKRFGYGACRIEQLLKGKGFLISHRQIEKLLLRNGLITPNLKKQKPRKWVRYELPNPNDLWHTDWSYDPYTQKQLSVYLDDRTRLITSFGIFSSANAENTIALLQSGILGYGKPKTVMTDHGAQYYANRPECRQENTQFRIALDALGIKHYVARVNRPQTNGKVERFFLSYKTEYSTGSFSGIQDYMRHYNEQRPHMSLGYKTPKQVWEECCKVVS
jgi:putative transposase